MKINEKLKSFMEVRDISIPDVAQRYGIEHQTLYNYVNGKRNIPLDFLVWMLAEYPELDANKLLRNTTPDFLAEDRENYDKKLSKKEALDVISRVLDELMK